MVNTPAREKGTAAMKVRNVAVRALIAAHEDEYEQLLGDAREAAGLPRDPDSAKREEQIARLRDKLRALGYEGEV
jgi:hypothetical protein